VELSLQERLESVKAGSLGAIAFGAVYGLAWGSNRYLGVTAGELWTPFSLNLEGLLAGLNANSLNLINIGGCLLSGFLFGVTYRYIIRQDNNPHLRDGAVLAFTLVRSGGLVELQVGKEGMVAAIALLMLESLIGFAVARSSLDWAMKKQWLKPLGEY
jgi:hypothetical protein